MARISLRRHSHWAFVVTGVPSKNLNGSGSLMPRSLRAEASGKLGSVHLPSPTTTGPVPPLELPPALDLPPVEVYPPVVAADPPVAVPDPPVAVPDPPVAVPDPPVAVPDPPVVADAPPTPDFPPVPTFAPPEPKFLDVDSAEQAAKFQRARAGIKTALNLREKADMKASKIRERDATRSGRRGEKPSWIA